jgi:hypothetical protein
MVRRLAHLNEGKARAQTLPAVHQAASLAKARWVDVEMRCTLMRAAVSAGAAYTMTTLARTSLLPLRMVDHSIASQAGWAAFGLHTQLINCNYPAVMRAAGLRQTHMDAMRNRVLLLLRLAKAHDHKAPVWPVLMASIDTATPLLRSTQTDAAVFLLDLDREGKDKEAWRTPWAVRPLAELCLMGMPETAATLTTIAKHHMMCRMIGEDPAPEIAKLVAELPDVSNSEMACSSAVTPPLGGASFCEAPIIPPGQWTVRQRLDMVASWMTVAGATKTSHHHPTMSALDGCRPKPYHLGKRGLTEALLHPLDGPSPLLWALPDELRTARKAFMLRNQHVLHPSRNPTTYKHCPLCHNASKGVLADLLDHLILDCTQTATIRADVLGSIEELLEGDRDLDREAGDTVEVVPPPTVLMEALTMRDIEGMHPTQAAKYRLVLHRLLLCGQWPTGAPELEGIDPKVAAAYSFPHKHKLRVEGPNPELGDQPVYIRPLASWRKVVRTSARYCAKIFDAVIVKIRAGKCIKSGAANRGAAIVDSRFVQAAVTGYTGPRHACEPKDLDVQDPDAEEGDVDDGGGVEQGVEGAPEGGLNPRAEQRPSSQAAADPGGEMLEVAASSPEGGEPPPAPAAGTLPGMWSGGDGGQAAGGAASAPGD